MFIVACSLRLNGWSDDIPTQISLVNYILVDLNQVVRRLYSVQRLGKEKTKQKKERVIPPL